MTVSETTYDVFISHASGDAEAAEELARELLDAEISPFYDLIVETADDAADIVWEALAESAAVVAVISPKSVSRNLALEIGAAKAWNKPVFLYVNGPASTTIPSMFSSYEVFSQNRVHDLVSAIVAAQRPLSEDDISSLSDMYADAGVTVDTLATSPAELDKLTRKFNKKVGTQLSGERALRELIRLRKQGKLPRVRKTQPKGS